MSYVNEVKKDNVIYDIQDKRVDVGFVNYQIQINSSTKPTDIIAALGDIYKEPELYSSIQYQFYGSIEAGTTYKGLITFNITNYGSMSYSIAMYSITNKVVYLSSNGVSISDTFNITITEYSFGTQLYEHVLTIPDISSNIRVVTTTSKQFTDSDISLSSEFSKALVVELESNPRRTLTFAYFGSVSLQYWNGTEFISLAISSITSDTVTKL